MEKKFTDRQTNIITETNILKKIILGIPPVSNTLDPGPNCLQRLPAGDKTLKLPLVGKELTGHVYTFVRKQIIVKSWLSSTMNLQYMHLLKIYLLQRKQSINKMDLLTKFINNIL